MIHVPVPASQLLLEKNLERFGELPGDVWKGDVLRFAGFDELPEIELCGFRLAVGGVNLLGAVPKTFAFHLFGLQEVFRHGIGSDTVVLSSSTVTTPWFLSRFPYASSCRLRRVVRRGFSLTVEKIRFREKRKWIQDKNYLNQETLSGKFFL